MNSITRDVFVKRKDIPWEIPYIRNTNAQPLQFRFCDFAIPENAEAQVYVQKPSGKAVYNNAVIDGNVVIVNVDTQMFAEVGNCELQLRISQGKDVLVTFDQPVKVYPNYTEGDAEQSRNESGFFGEYETKMNNAIDKANEAAENADKKVEDIQNKVDNGDFTGSIQIRDVKTGEAGSEASVENIGTNKDAVLDITIPRGNRGASMRLRGKWTSNTDYFNNTEYIDIVTHEGSTYGCIASHTSSEATQPNQADAEYWLCIVEKGETGNVENIGTVKIPFQKAAELANIESGDSISIALGKLAKLYEDLEGGKVIGSDLSEYVKTSRIVTSAEITEPGYLMDGKTASEKFAEVDDGLTGKQSKITGGATTIVSSNLTAGRALVSNSSGKVEASSVTSKQLGYLSGATGNIQNQINNKNYLKDKGGDNTITFDWTSSGLEVYVDSTKIGAVQIV